MDATKKNDFALWELVNSAPSINARKAAFGELYHRNFQRLVWYLYGLNSDRFELEDCTEIVSRFFARKLEEIENNTVKFPKPISGNAWLQRCAKNLWIDLWRQKKRNPHIVKLEEDLSLGLIILTGDFTHSEIEEMIGSFKKRLSGKQAIVFEGLLEGLPLKTISQQNGWANRVASDCRHQIKLKAKEFLAEFGIGA